MKPLLHVVLALALLLQGALAVAMPVSAPAASTEMPMPCHRGDHQKSMPCCAHHQCACQAICSSVALPIIGADLVAPMHSVAPVASPPSGARTAHRLTPLRPPIEFSA